MSGEGEPRGGSAQADAPPLKLDDWLALLRRQPGLGDAEIDRAAERALLDLTRIAAHTSERIAGPITAYLVGLALAALPTDERAARIRALVEALEREADVRGQVRA